MKVLLAILGLLQIFLASLLVAPVLVDGHGLAEAISNYHHAPTIENKMSMEREQQITARIRSTTRIAILVLFALNTGGLAVVYRRLQHAQKVS